MIKIKHPDEQRNRSQEEFLANCPPDQRRFHELLFTHGNITYRYHQRSREFNPTEREYHEWLEGLPDNVRKGMQKMGFDRTAERQCKTVLSFTRYVMEKNDVGLDEYIRQHMDSDDYEEYISMIGK